MARLIPTPQDVRNAPELALLASLAYCLESTQIALAATYPSIGEDEADLDDDHTEQGAYARALFRQIDAILPIVDAYIASVHRAVSPGNRRPRRSDEIPF